MKKFYFFMMVILVLVLCTSCMKNDGDSAKLNDIPEKLTGEQGENLLADAEIVIPRDIDLSKLDILTADWLRMDSDKAYELFSGNQDLPLFQESTIQKGEESVERNVYEIGESGMLGVSQAQIFLWTDQYQLLRRSLRSAFNAPVVNESLSKFSADGDLPFMTREKAAAETRELLAEIGLITCDTYEWRLLDAQTLNEQEMIDSMNPEEPPPADWAQEDNFYYFIFSQEIEGLPLVNSIQLAEGSATTVPQTTTECIYGKNGVVGVNLQNFYTKTGVKDADVAIISLEQALEQIKNKYNNLISDEPYVIERISLEYFPQYEDETQTGYILSPVWSFRVKCPDQITPDSDHLILSQTDLVLVDAISGKIIV